MSSPSCATCSPRGAPSWPPKLRGTLTPEQAARRAAIASAYVRTQALGGPDDDPLTRAVAALGLLADRVAAVESAITRASAPGAGTDAGRP
ncbi:4'-phosphopantetheinyl transferase EntD [Streptomyces netropsis]|uniref:4'-phosphopantetheinyl transferase EntD n=1 Tax=Streptomyces netropsis TaxID=55404 RepID=A0A7W7PFF2_STRNE|nr:4'-phosphopantetheinyl transferase EntD [Streptomyces netropsis]GGR08449.1 hypothetical protein GCM10010219_11030 [Streptomyces netropsis]